MTLTVIQKILRPVINFLVERYFPNGSFYGKEFMSVFSNDELVNKWGSDMSVAASFLTSNMLDINADTGEFSFVGMSKNGEHVGDWKLTIERIDA